MPRHRSPTSPFAAWPTRETLDSVAANGGVGVPSLGLKERHARNGHAVASCIDEPETSQRYIYGYLASLDLHLTDRGYYFRFSAMTSRQNQQQPTHTAVWYQDMISELQTHGISPRQLIGNTGIRLSDLDVDEPRLSFAVIAELFERAAELTGNDLFGLKLGQKREMRRLGLVAFIGRSSPTVGSLLRNLARYQRVFSDAIDINVDQLDDNGIVSWRFNVPQSVPQRQYIEADGAGIIHWLRALTRTNLSPETVEFRHFRQSNQNKIEQFFGCPVKFGAEANRLKLKFTDLDTPLITSDDYLYQMLLHYANDALRNHPSAAPDIVVCVEQEIAKDLRATQADVARSLGMSPRTLARRLADEGTSFLSVVDGYRETLARSLISETNLQITEIAFALGYNSPSTFSTAFRRWTGRSPSTMRGSQGRQQGSSIR